VTLRVFIGADERQPIAFNVAQHSIYQHATKPVAVTKLCIDTLPVKRRGLTSFTFTRYLVPWLCDYQGWALFADADILFRGDIAGLPWEAEAAVSVVQHSSVIKAGQEVSTIFERNAVMLFNCAKCKNLTPEYIEAGSPNKLSEWAESIGELPKEWNHLVGYDAPNQAAKIAHFTMGIPCFPETGNDEFAAEWREAHKNMNGTVPWKEIMGRSVHARWKV
jgi:hypothetical protein